MTILPSRILAGVDVPDSPQISSALEFVKAHSDPALYNHVVRSWLFALTIARGLYPHENLDLEAISVAALLHDMGFDPTKEFVSEDNRFEVDGANAARHFILNTPEAASEDWNKHRVQLVWDTIALHTSASIALFKEPEVAGTCAGIMVDLVGPKRSVGGILKKELYDEVMKQYPALELKKGLKDGICELCRSKPSTTWDNFTGDFGDRFVDGYREIRELNLPINFILASIE